MPRETVKLREEKFPFHLPRAIASVSEQSVSHFEKVFSVLVPHKVAGVKNHFKKLGS